MCCEDRCCCCIPVDVGSLILGVFTSIINAIGILSCIGVLVYVNEFQYKEEYGGCFGSYCGGINSDGYVTTYRRDQQIAVNTGLSVGLVLFLIDFAFSVTLADGASKKIASHIKAYFIYGVVKNVLAVIGCIICFFIIIPVGIIMLIPIVFYGLLLVMVYKTHKKFTGGYVRGGEILKSQDDQVQLV